MNALHAARMALSVTFVAGLGGLEVSAQQSKPTWPDVVVHLHGSGHAYIVDTKSDKVVADLATGKGGTLGATTPDGKKVYVSNAAPGETEVVVIDLGKREVTARIKTGNRPKHGIVSPDGKLVGVNHWGLDGDKLRVSFIDTATDKVTRQIDVPVTGPKVEPGKSLADMIKGVTSMHNAWSNDGRFFLTVNRVDNEFIAIDVKERVYQRIAVPSAPHYLAPSPDGKEVWLVVEGKSADNPPMVLIYDIASGFREKGRIAMPVVDKGTIEGHHGNFTQDGKHFMLLNRGAGKPFWSREMVVIDVATRKVVKAIETRSAGIGHTYNTPDGKLAFVTNYGNNVVSIVDTTKWEVVKDLILGWGRMGHVAFTQDGKSAYVSNDFDGVLYKVDMATLEMVSTINTNGKPGGGQVLNVWTNVFEELPR
jgi:YVTN family beta-propeller protein